MLELRVAHLSFCSSPFDAPSEFSKPAGRPAGGRVAKALDDEPEELSPRRSGGSSRPSTRDDDEYSSTRRSGPKSSSRSKDKG